MNQHDPDLPSDDDIPQPIPQGLLRALSIIVAIALVLGSASIIITLAEPGDAILIVIGVVIVTVLAIAWLRRRAGAAERRAEREIIVARWTDRHE